MKSWLLVAVVVAACGGAGEYNDAHVSPLELCALCTSDADCVSGLCRMYGDGYRKCSHTCTVGQEAIDCPAPAEGFCNNMGYCGCPVYQPPTDASVDDSYKDAPEVPVD